jgi:hypothetical protein
MVVKMCCCLLVSRQIAWHSQQPVGTSLDMPCCYSA